MQKAIIFLLIIALFLPSASAEFLAFGDASIKLGPCETTTGSITVQNTGQEQATYSISVDGEGSDWATFSAINFILQPGQYTTITSFYTIPCNTRTGTYPLMIYFSDEKEEQQLEQEIIITLSDNINITAKETSAVIAPCDSAAYTLDLYNPSNFTEIYTITAEGHQNAHVSEKQTVLKAREHKNIIISVTPDDCTQSGIFPLTASFDTEKSNQHKEQPLELIIKSTDIPILAEGTSRIRTDYIDSTAELTIQNTGDRTTQYTLSTQGLTWATISPSSATLNPGQTKTIALRLAPDQNTQKGSYPLILTATVDETGIKYSKEITIKLQPLAFYEKNPAILIAIAIIILALLVGAYFLIRYLRSQSFKEALKRWKEKRRIWREKREAMRKAREQKRAEMLKKRLEQERKELERKQAEKEKIKKQLQRKIEQDFKKEYHIVAKKEVITGKTKKGKGLAAIIFGILLLILIALGWSIIIPNLQYVLLGLAILAVIYIAKELARLTVIKKRWKTLAEKQTATIRAWKTGLSLLDITTKKTINNLRVIIKKTKPRVAPSPAIYQTFLIKANVDAPNYKATFTIPKQWLARKHGEETKLARYANQTWTTIQLKKTGEGKEVIHYSAEIKEGTYCIYTKPAKQPAKPTSRTKKLIWGIIGIALIAAIAVVMSPQPSTIAHGIPPQTWQQDTVHKIDLNKYFTDPDGDKLSYTTTETKHITIEISGNTAYLTPDSGWTGEEKARFIASDAKGGQASSNTVSLRVQRHIIPVSIQPYIAIVLSILAIITLIFVAYTHSRSKKK